MLREIAVEFAKVVRGYLGHYDYYEIEEKELDDGQLIGFHQWADGKPCEGAFLVRSDDSNALWFLLIDWRNSNNFYLVVFPEDKRKGPLIEFHDAIEDGNGMALLWKYKPTKQDGRNEERREYFEQLFSSLEVVLSVPATVEELDDCIEEVFSLVEARRRSDNLIELRPEIPFTFPEGMRVQRLHVEKERDPRIIEEAKRRELEATGRLTCSCCEFDFYEVYGALGRGFIEGHHTKPISTLSDEGENVSVEDIALVCSNCHRMLHRRRPWLDKHALKQLLLKK